MNKNELVCKLVEAAISLGTYFASPMPDWAHSWEEYFSEYIKDATTDKVMSGLMYLESAWPKRFFRMNREEMKDAANAAISTPHKVGGEKLLSECLDLALVNLKYALSRADLRDSRSGITHCDALRRALCIHSILVAASKL